ncbi:MAG: hypothetical protein IKZ59_01285, partial [Clostridia bacterium]|nr:hypothetical protein [Clostridia bacterium]
MKSRKSRGEIFRFQRQVKSSVLRSVKLNPSYTPRSGISPPKAISPTEGGFLPSARTDLVEKTH